MKFRKFVFEITSLINLVLINNYKFFIWKHAIEKYREKTSFNDIISICDLYKFIVWKQSMLGKAKL